MYIRVRYSIEYIRESAILDLSTFRSVPIYLSLLTLLKYLCIFHFRRSLSQRPKLVTSRMAVWVERLTGVPCLLQNHSGSSPLLVRKRSYDVSGLQGFNQKQRNVMPYLSMSTHQSKKHNCWKNVGKTSQEQVQIRGLSVQEGRVGHCQRTWSWLRLQAGCLWRMWQGNYAGRAHWSFEVLSWESFHGLEVLWRRKVLHKCVSSNWNSVTPFVRGY